MFGLIQQLQRTHAIVNPTMWDPITARANITGGGDIFDPPLNGAENWEQGDWLFLDCWDRDALDETSAKPTRSAFFALDLLIALRSAREAGTMTPRVVAHSRGMHDNLVRATLAEFLYPRHQPEPGRDKWRVTPSKEPGILWAMYDRTDMEDELGDIVLNGKRTKALAPPKKPSTEWDFVGPQSCLATYHCKVRDSAPDAWRDNVVSTSGKIQAGETEQKQIVRLAERFLDTPPGRKLGYAELLRLVRSIANPQL